MVSPNQKVVVMLEKPIHGARPKESKMDTISGIIDYTTIVAETHIARMQSYFSLSNLDGPAHSAYRDVSSHTP